MTLTKMRQLNGKLSPVEQMIAAASRSTEAGAMLQLPSAADFDQHALFSGMLREFIESGRFWTPERVAAIAPILFEMQREVDSIFARDAEFINELTSVLDRQNETENRTGAMVRCSLGYL